MCVYIYINIYTIPFTQISSQWNDVLFIFDWQKPWGEADSDVEEWIRHVDVPIDIHGVDGRSLANELI